MKTSTLPSLRVDPELRKAAEDILDDGQTLSSFIEEAVRHEVQRRKIRRDFLKKALAAEAEAEAAETRQAVVEPPRRCDAHAPLESQFGARDTHQPHHLHRV